MVSAAKHHDTPLNEERKPIKTKFTLVKARAILAGVIGESVASSEE